jgi:hypothetical protein
MGLLGSADIAQAAGVYGAELTAQLTLTGFFDVEGTSIARPPELVIEGETMLLDQSTVVTGSAEAEAPFEAEVLAADPWSLTLGDGVSLRASSVGTAAVPTGLSEALAATYGIVFFDNRSATESFRVTFVLEYAWLLDVGLGAADAGMARADVTLLLASLSGGTLFGSFEEAIADPLAPGSRTDRGAFSGELLLAPLDFDELTLITDATGSAAVVPEPPALSGSALSLLALLAVCAARARAIG